MQRTVITGTGSYIPTEVKTNMDFTQQDFYTEDKSRIDIEQKIIVEKFRKITGIAERRYASDNLNTSDIAVLAAERPLPTAVLTPKRWT